MKPTTVRATFILLSATLLCGTISRAEEKAGSSAEAQAAFAKLVETCRQGGWSEQLEARRKLIALGSESLPLVQKGAESHEDRRVRRSCFDLLLSDTFAKDYSLGERLMKSGLRDTDEVIRYQCAFEAGSRKITSAKPDLQGLLRDQEQSDRIRFTAAKSLAELGDPQGMLVLYRAIRAESYMDRYIGNIGLKAISGKNLDDFEGYQFGEGRFVSGGLEFQMPAEPIRDSEQKARRFLAIAAYSRWLRDSRPDLYRRVSYSFNRDWDFVGPPRLPQEAQ